MYLKFDASGNAEICDGHVSGKAKPVIQARIQCSLSTIPSRGKYQAKVGYGSGKVGSKWRLGKILYANSMQIALLKAKAYAAVNKWKVVAVESC